MKTNIQLIERSNLKKIIEGIKTDLILIVMDNRVWQLYGKSIEKIMPTSKSFYLYKSLEGEETKCFKEFERGITFFLEKGVHRSAHLLAIGGGATSDYAGYLASSLLRGIKWSIIPTTLLSMVDAAIGGKTGLNTLQGKNLIGSFYMPENVWIDQSFLNTLSKEEMKSGMGEIIKYALLKSDVNDLVKNNSSLRAIIKACADAKAEVVRQDFKEDGIRMCLNLGHTFGHALERIYSISHGEAVFWGMGLVFKLFQNDFKYIKALREYSVCLNAKFEKPPWLNKTFPIDKVMEFLEKDKKKTSVSAVKIIKIKEIGIFDSEEVSFTAIRKKLEDNKDELRTFSY